MENNQNNDNQNITGITSSTGLPAEPMPHDMQTQSKPAVPEEEIHNTEMKMTETKENESIPSNPEPSKGEEAIDVKPVNKTIVGGVDPVKAETKGGITDFIPSINEITASRNKYAMMGLIVGVLLLVIALGGYYFLQMYSQPVETPVETPTEQVTETPTLPPLEEDIYIQNINQLEATSSESDLNDLSEKLQMVDFEGIDPQDQ